MNLARKNRFLALLPLLVALAPAVGGEVLDRIAAKVNHQAIMLSDVEDELRFEQFSAGTEAPGISMDEALQRLVDRALIEQQMARTAMPAAPEKEVEARVLEFRKQVLPDAPDALWLQKLAASNLSNEEVTHRIAEELRIARYIDMRFRATVRVGRAEIEAYYEKELKPRAQAHGQPLPPIEKVSSQIAEILTQQQINDHLNEWLQSLRNQAQIEIRLASQAGSGAAVSP